MDSVNIKIELEATHAKDGGRLCMDVQYDLRRRFDVRFDDYVEEAKVTLTAVVPPQRHRPQNLSRDLLAWLEASYHTRMNRATVTAGGSTVRKNWQAIRKAARPDLAELSLTTHARRKGDPYIEID